MDLGIEGRVALVLGASRGIGRAIAEALGREGARVALASRSAEALAEVAAGIDAETAVVPVDTSDEDAVAALPGRVEAALGPVDILVLNTGGPPAGGALDADADAWRDAYPVASARPARARTRLRAGDAGARLGPDRQRLVDLGPRADPEPGALSNANRMATVGLLDTLAREVAADGVTVNTIATGRFATGSLEGAEEQARAEVPAGRLGRPEEYGDLVAFVCSDRAGYLTGTLIPLDGGITRSS